jgi:hypothetical protein
MLKEKKPNQPKKQEQAKKSRARQMIRKRRSNAFSKAKGVAGYVVHPVRLAI